MYSSALNEKAAMLSLIAGAVVIDQPVDDALGFGFTFIKPQNLKTQSGALRARVNIEATCHGRLPVQLGSWNDTQQVPRESVSSHTKTRNSQSVKYKA